MKSKALLLRVKFHYRIFPVDYELVIRLLYISDKFKVPYRIMKIIFINFNWIEGNPVPVKCHVL